MSEPTFLQCIRAPVIHDEWRTALQEADFAKATKSAEVNAMRRFFWVNWGVVDQTGLTLAAATFSQLLVMVWAEIFVTPSPGGAIFFSFWFGSLACYSLLFHNICRLYNLYRDGYRSEVLAAQYRELHGSQSIRQSQI